MHQRTRVTGETLRRVAAELAGLPVSAGVAQSQVETIETLMRGIDELRRLPLKELAPPLVFVPEEDLK